MGLAARRRQRPVVERSTFVIASVGDVRVAMPVEQVERVLRSARADDSVAFADRTLAVYSLHTLLTGDSAPMRMTPHDAFDHAAEQRVLVVHTRQQQEPLMAVRVDGVHDVSAIETALVRPLAAQGDGPYCHAAVRGCFDRDDLVVWVLDTVRLTEHR